MSWNLINTGILAMAFLALFSFAELLYRRFKVQAEVTRKIVHVVTGIITLLFPPLIGNHWLVLFLCGSFLLILLVSFPLKMLPSINAVDRKTRGSLIYPVIVYCSFLIYLEFDNLTFYYIPILTLALCDPIAALVGKRFPWGRYKTFGHTKTMSGSFGFFFSAAILSILLLIQLEEIPPFMALLASLCIAFTTTIAEALTHKGYDNLTIPATALGVLLIFESCRWI
ncbi:MAG: phytol kinase [Crocinitomicaceae bacterium]|jgi:phytol kinase